MKMTRAYKPTTEPQSIAVVPPKEQGPASTNPKSFDDGCLDRHTPTIPSWPSSSP
ncbi:hypothetical protein BD310DRAFT_918210, partial [Dichomitus squalens]